MSWLINNISKDLITHTTKEMLGITDAYIARSMLAIVDPWSNQTGRILYSGGPAWTWEDIEGYSRAILGVIGGTYGTIHWGPHGGIVGKYGALTLADIIAGAAGWYGTRMDRPYKWWSPMRWLPQEEYLRREYGIERTAPSTSGIEDNLRIGDKFPLFTTLERFYGSTDIDKFPPDDYKKFPPLPPDDHGGGGGVGGLPISPFAVAQKELGGIQLGATAELKGNFDLGNIVGAVWDDERQCLVLLGEENTTMPSLNAADLAVALKSIFDSHEEPAFSLILLINQTQAGLILMQYTMAPLKGLNSDRPCLMLIGG